MAKHETAIEPKHAQGASVAHAENRFGMRSLLAAAVVFLLAAAFSSAATFAYMSSTTNTVDNVFTKGVPYTLVYEANTGSTDEDTKVAVPAAAIKYVDSDNNPVDFTVEDVTPTRSGFVFSKWNTKANGTGDSYDPTSTFTAPAGQRESTLYAQWEAGYTLIYDANGGTGAPAPVTQVTDVASYTFDSISDGLGMTGPLEDDGTDDHRVFLGWATTPNATEPEYTSDGELEYENTPGDYDKDKVDGFETRITANADSVDPVTGNKKTVRLYAVWATQFVLEYSLHDELMDPESHGPVPATQTLVSTKGSHVFQIPKRVTKEMAEADPSLVENAPSRDGGYCWGWWGDNKNRFNYREDATYNEGCYLFDEPFRALTKQVPTATLYAYFQPPAGFSLTYDENDSQFATADQDKNDIENMPDPVSVSLVSTQIDWDPAITSSIPTHAKYTFEGWSEDPDATEPTYKSDDPAYKNKIVINRLKKADVTLYAVWSHKHKFRLYFNRSSQENSYTQTYYYKEKNASGDYIWKSASTSSNDYVYFEKGLQYRTESEYFMDDSMTISAEEFADLGVFATRPTDSYGEYKFLGWSYTDYPTRGPNQFDKNNPEHVIEFPVTAPVNPSSPQGDEGLIKNPIIMEESDPPCTSPITHPTRLYPVWERSPLHNFQIRFERNDSSEKIYRGTSYTSYYDYTYPNDYTNPRKTTVRAIDEPTHTWEVAGWTGETAATTYPTATKNATETATYKFIGWSETKNKTELDDGDYPVDNSGKLTKSITLGDETEEAAKDCGEGTHSIRLYPVFEPTPRHKYYLYFDANAPSTATGITTTIYQQKEDGTWVTPTLKSYSAVKDVDGTQRSMSGKTLLFSQQEEKETKSLSWPSDYTDANPKPTLGMFATCINGNTTASQKFKFVGWSYTKYSLTGASGTTKYEPGVSPVEFPVSNVANPANIQPGEGLMNDPVVINVDQAHPESDMACTDEKGQNHHCVLYGVWEGEVLHQYTVTFNGNGAGSEVLYGTKEQFDNNTLTSAGVDKPLVKYSPALPMPDIAEDDSTEKFVFGNDYFHGIEGVNPEKKQLQLKAKRATGDRFEYTFVGWSLDSNTQPSETSKILPLDSDGFLNTEAIVAECEPQYPCDGSKAHNVNVYAVWGTRAVHRYSVIFNPGDSGGTVQYKNGSNWANSNTTIGKNAKDAADLNLTSDLKGNYRAFSDYLYLDQATSGSYTWGPSNTEDPKKTLAVRATRTDNSGKIAYEFLGWTTDKSKSVPSPNYTTADVEIAADTDGTLGDITLTEPASLTSCEYDTHNRIYYPVFKTDPIHSFRLNFDWNGATRFRMKNVAGSWVDSSWADNTRYKDYYSYPADDSSIKLSESDEQYTWKAEGFWNTRGIGARKAADVNYNYEFVGWSKTRQTKPTDPVPADTYAWMDDPDSNQDGDGYITEDITINCSDAGDDCAGGRHDLTLYAVWKAVPKTKTYNLVFNGNGDDTVENIPDAMSTTETYNGTAWKNTGTITVPKPLPTERPKYKELTFVGWHTNPSSDSGTYGYEYPKEEDYELWTITKHLKNQYTTKAIANDVYETTDTLYAIWLYRYDLDYNSNGGANGPKLEHAYKSISEHSFPVSTVIPTHPNGYAFLGWSENQNATTADYQAGDMLSMDASATGRIEKTLYAVWDKPGLNGASTDGKNALSAQSEDDGINTDINEVSPNKDVQGNQEQQSAAKDSDVQTNNEQGAVAGNADNNRTTSKVDNGTTDDTQHDTSNQHSSDGNQAVGGSSSHNTSGESTKNGEGNNTGKEQESEEQNAHDASAQDKLDSVPDDEGSSSSSEGGGGASAGSSSDDSSANSKDKPTPSDNVPSDSEEANSSDAGNESPDSLAKPAENADDSANSNEDVSKESASSSEKGGE